MKQLLILTLLFLMFIHLGMSQNAESPKATIAGVHSISSHNLLEYVEELSSEKYGGRLTGSPGYDSAANWVCRFFKKYQLTPGGDPGSFLQKFTIPFTEVFPGCEMSLSIPYSKDTILKHFKYVSEFIPGSTSDSGVVHAEVVYAGYGITAPELNYDDFSEVNVRGKIVLIEPETPLNPFRNKELFKKWEPYSYHQYKLKNVADHGAIGMLYNYGPIANPNNGFIRGFIYSHVGDSVVNDLFKGTGNSHDEIIGNIRGKLKPRSFETGKFITIKNNTVHHPEGIGSNVLGILEGSDPVLKNECIVLGAHLDHLGYCYELMPGANDNASGVAILIEVMRALKEFSPSLKRSVVFAAFGAEEQALIGSKTYLEKPPFPLSKTIGLLNLDGVGVGDRITALGGKNFPELFSALENANTKYIHRSLTATEFINITRPRLDAARFEKAGIPVLSFSTGGVPSVYHQPGDNIHTITPEIMEDLARMIYLGIIELANR
jgi:hypothetical protein